ncbi:MAG: NAD(P)/FAD-dependent oxidoreductase [Rhodobacteraceae bacterium]|nr:NAD(P)/FAD-dependent oxidoreductase [Paracoccaceae bacterium]
MADFDAVLVGSGVNALAAAVHLGARGWRVGLFEANASPGGAVRTGEYTLPGFRHDWAAMNLSLFAGSPFFREHGQELVRHGCAFVPVADPFCSSFPDGSWCGVSTDRAATRARIAAFSARDAEAWDRLCDGFAAEAPALFGLLGSPARKRALAYFGFKTLRARGLAGSAALARFLLQSSRAWLEGTFESPQVRAMLGAWGMHLDFAPDVAGGALFPYLEGMAGQAFGMVLGKGGADTIVRAMVAAIRARGGTVETGIPVARILHDGRRAEGVELADGRRIAARRAVIAGVAPAALPGLTGGTTPGFDAAMRAFVHAPGTMMIHLALAAPPDWAAGAGPGRFAYVHLAPSLDQMARTYAEAQAGLLPAEPVIVVGQPTEVDPTRAPEGRHILWLQVRMAPATIRGDAAGEIAATSWAEAAAPFASRALAIVERHAPGLSGRILASRIVPPTELEADNPNLVGGDQICGSHHLAQHFVFRPAPGHADGSTPIAGLHLTGAAVWPGAGTGAGAGFLLARRLAGN